MIRVRTISVKIVSTYDRLTPNHQMGTCIAGTDIAEKALFNISLDNEIKEEVL
jgi:hypothetical protein